jgi:transcriptional regulator with PAS, ATPase and Fis domain
LQVLASVLRAAVGERPLGEIEQAARHIMVMEALARAGGSKTRAARLLGISRQLLQHILRGQKRLRPLDPLRT